MMRWLLSVVKRVVFGGSFAAAYAGRKQTADRLAVRRHRDLLAGFQLAQILGKPCLSSRTEISIATPSVIVTTTGL